MVRGWKLRVFVPCCCGAWGSAMVLVGGEESGWERFYVSRKSEKEGCEWLEGRSGITSWVEARAKYDNQVYADLRK